jgi:hypothetical protein
MDARPIVLVVAFVCSLSSVVAVVEAFSSGAISGFLFAANSSIASSDIFCSIQTFLDVVSFPRIIFLDCFVFVFIDPNASVKGATMRCHAGLIHSVVIFRSPKCFSSEFRVRIALFFCFVLFLFFHIPNASVKGARMRCHARIHQSLSLRAGPACRPQ